MILLTMMKFKPINLRMRAHFRISAHSQNPAVKWTIPARMHTKMPTKQWIQVEGWADGVKVSKYPRKPRLQAIVHGHWRKWTKHLMRSSVYEFQEQEWAGQLQIRKIIQRPVKFHPLQEMSSLRYWTMNTIVLSPGFMCSTSGPGSQQ